MSCQSGIEYSKTLYFLTVWLTVAEVLVMKFAFPAYIAVIWWAPCARVEMDKDARPVPLRLAEPMILFLSLNVIVPEGIPEPGLLAVTVASKVTTCPLVEGLSEEVNVVVLLSLFTCCVNGVEV